jgi:hypothetical protein
MFIEREQIAGHDDETRASVLFRTTKMSFYHISLKKIDDKVPVAGERNESTFVSF